MRQSVIPLLVPMTKHGQNGDGCYVTKARGLAVLNSPLLNKGAAFSEKNGKRSASRGCSRRTLARWVFRSNAPTVILAN